jgi:beta-glucosidase
LSGLTSPSILCSTSATNAGIDRSTVHEWGSEEIMSSQTVTRRTLGVSLAALAAASSTLARAATPAGGKPLYKDPASRSNCACATGSRG